MSNSTSRRTALRSVRESLSHHLGDLAKLYSDKANEAFAGVVNLKSLTAAQEESARDVGRLSTFVWAAAEAGLLSAAQAAKFRKLLVPGS